MRNLKKNQQKFRPSTYAVHKIVCDRNNDGEGVINNHTKKCPN